MQDAPVDRRTLLASGGAAVAALAGCISTSRTPPGQRGSAPEDGSSAGGGERVEPLRVDGSSTVYPITNTAAAYWSSNRPADDEEYWGPGQYGIETDERLADYWAGRYGFEPGEEGRPPFAVDVGLSHSGTGLEKLRNEQVDIGNASAPVEAELPDADQETLDRFENHVVAVDAQPLVVSRQIYEAGVTKLTGEQVRAIYRGELTNWTEIDSYGGDSKEIQAVGRAEGSGTDTAFRVNMLGGPDAPMAGVDSRKGQNQQVKSLVQQSDNAIAYMALAFVDDSIPAIALEFEGTTYELGENLGSAEYPLSRDLHCYTWEGTSKKEAAFLGMILSEYGQQNFVEPEGYSMLPADRREEELGRLPEAEE